jgi:RNA polymerase sigma factor (sigma-70 family)
VTATETQRRKTQRAVEAVWRLESPRIIAGLARLTGDLSLAEDLAQDALVAALSQWPQAGIPPNPGAWLMSTARHRAIDRLRRDQRLRRNLGQLGHELHTRQQTAVFEGPADLTAKLDALDAGEVQDDLLRLMFVACHPVLSADARVALTLRLLGGLTTDEIARAFLATEPAIAQRIVRAKRTLARKQVPFEVPSAGQRPARLASVLEAIYLIFNEGYTATAGEDWARPELCYEALRLGRMLAELSPDEPEVHGLAALMEIQSSRLRARAGPGGEPIPLLEQDRGRWDRLLIRRGFAALLRAERLGQPPGPYLVQAAIAACHAQAATAADTDWPRIAALYQTLAAIAPSPVAELNRAVAVGMAHGPARGLDLADRLAARPELRRYHLLPSVRGDLLAKLGRDDEARAEFERAAALTRNAQERAVLLRRAADCGRGGQP